MSIYNSEIVRVDGSLKAYIEVQNDWTGNIRYRLCTIHIDGDDYYCIADGRRVILNDERRRVLDREDEIKRALASRNKKFRR